MSSGYSVNWILKANDKLQVLCPVAPDFADLAVDKADAFMPPVPTTPHAPLVVIDGSFSYYDHTFVVTLVYDADLAAKRLWITDLQVTNRTSGINPFGRP